MNTFLKILGALYLIIWTLIGAAILAGAVTAGLFVSGGGFQQMMQSAGSQMFQGVVSGLSGPGGIGEIIPPGLMECGKRVLGEKRVSELLQGSQPTTAEQEKLSKSCGEFFNEEMMKK
ncbi:hypothetical protein HY479_03115 [Candidatus Uhrbacteria bacterium]|nr:hypothetical protein [Candidatus Uhrbacteria bacterium]